jgi:hypothetical protein
MALPLSRCCYLASATALMGLAFALRLLYLDEWPPGQHADEAFKVLRALHLLEGRWAAFFWGEGSTEPFHLIPRALWTAIFPADTFMSRLLTVVCWAADGGGHSGAVPVGVSLSPHTAAGLRCWPLSLSPRCQPPC